MSLIENVKAAGAQAASAARESLEEAQLNHDLARAYSDLGQLTFLLVEEGAISDRRLIPGMECIRDLSARLAAPARSRQSPAAQRGSV